MTLPLLISRVAEVWRLPVPRAPNQGGTRSPSTTPNRMTEFLYRTICCTHLLLLFVVRWKNTLILGIDACFKVKLKDRGVQDPDLLTGSAYIVNENLYQSYLSANTDVPEPVNPFFRRFC